MGVQKVHGELMDLRRKIVSLESGLSHAAPAGKAASFSIQYLQAVIRLVSELIDKIQPMISNHSKS